jgi:two-component system LytT family sensor kinase
VLRRHLLRGALGLAGWSALSLFFASEMWLGYSQNGQAAPFRFIFLLALCTWGTWAFFAPAVVALARRFPFARPQLTRAVFVHACGATAVIAAKLWVDALARALAFQGKPSIRVTEVHMTLLTYVAVVAVVHAAALWRRAQERELRASQLESRLAQAQLHALEAQLHPHFLFNTLHAISALVRSDPAAADRTIAALADLLRLSLQRRGTQEVPLRQELDFVSRYLEIEQTRFHDRLRVAFEVAEEALDGRLPILVLQPLVENAIRHGIAPRAAGGSLRIAAARRNGMLCVEVEDDGVGLPSEGVREGVGLANTRARLEQLYGKGDRLLVGARPGGGVRVELRVPWQVAT